MSLVTNIFILFLFLFLNFKVTVHCFYFVTIRNDENELKTFQTKHYELNFSWTAVFGTSTVLHVLSDLL